MRNLDGGIFHTVAGVVVLIVTCCVFFGFAGSAAYVQFNRPLLDALNCPKSGVRSITVLLIDSNGSPNGTQAAEIRHGVRKIVGALEEGSALHVYRPRQNKAFALEPDFEGCKIRENASWYENRDAVRQKFEKEFRLKVNEAVERVLELPARVESPILESLVDIGVQSFRPVPPHSNKRLFVVSDLIQNTTALSHRQSIPNKDLFRALPAAAVLTPRLTDVSVCLVYLSRATGQGVQGMKHVRFWQDIFDLSGATLGSCAPFSEDPDVVVVRL